MILSKIFSKLVAFGTGIVGIIYTLFDVINGAIIMDALSAIAALVIGIENLRFFKTHKLLKRAVLLAEFGIVIS